MIKKLENGNSINDLMETHKYGYFCDMGFVCGEKFQYLPDDLVILDAVNGYFIINYSDMETKEPFFIKLTDEAIKETGGVAPFYPDGYLE